MQTFTLSCYSEIIRWRTSCLHALSRFLCNSPQKQLHCGGKISVFVLQSFYVDSCIARAKIWQENVLQTLINSNTSPSSADNELKSSKLQDYAEWLTTMTTNFWLMQTPSSENRAKNQSLLFATDNREKKYVIRDVIHCISLSLLALEWAPHSWKSQPQPPSPHSRYTSQLCFTPLLFCYTQDKGPVLYFKIPRLPVDDADFCFLEHWQTTWLHFF